MICSVHDDSQRAANGPFIVPIAPTLQQRYDSLVGFFELSFVCIPFLRGNFVDAPPYLAPIHLTDILLKDIRLHHFEIKVNVCNLCRQRSAFSSDPDRSLRGCDGLEGLEQGCALIEEYAMVSHKRLIKNLE